MPNVHHNEEVRAVDVDIGDGEMPGIAQELTTDDIDDIAMDPNLSVGERRERLMELKDEIGIRRSADDPEDAFHQQDMGSLLAYVDGRIASLGNASLGGAELAAAGMDTDDRSDDDDPADHVDDEDEDLRLQDLSKRTI